MFAKNSPLWHYLSEGQKGLLKTGEFLLHEASRYDQSFPDFSYLVFPFAKAYEGFLKQLFLDKGFISHREYISDRFRIGKALNPNLATELPEQSVFLKIKTGYSEEIAFALWDTWKRGRNLLFHYFPHNMRALTFEESKEISDLIVNTIKEAFIQFQPVKSKR